MNVQKSILRVFNWSNWTRLFFCHSCCDCWREMSYQDPEDDGREEATNEALPGLLGRQLQEEWRRQRHKQHQRLNEEEEEEGRTWRRRRIKRRTHLDEGRAAEEEAKHVGHDVVTDDAGDRHDEPGRQQKNHSSNSSILLVMYFVQFFFFFWLFNSADVPDHPLKQVVDDQVRLGHHNQQGHVGPTKLWKQHNAVSQMASCGNERNCNITQQRKSHRNKIED